MSGCFFDTKGDECLKEHPGAAYHKILGAMGFSEGSQPERFMNVLSTCFQITAMLLMFKSRDAAPDGPTVEVLDLLHVEVVHPVQVD